MSYNDLVKVEWFSHSSGELRSLAARIGGEWFEPHSGRSLKPVSKERAEKLEKMYQEQLNTRFAKLYTAQLPE